DVDGIRREAAAEDVVGLEVPGRQPLGGIDHGLAQVPSAVGDRERRGRRGRHRRRHRASTTALAFIITPLIAARKVDSTSGLRRNAAAPASFARAAAARRLNTMTGT